MYKVVYKEGNKPGEEWELSDDGLCYDRYPTKEAAEVDKAKLEGENKVYERAQALIDEAVDTLMEEFSLTDRAEAEKWLKEAVKGW